MTKQTWIDSYNKLMEESLQFAPCQVGDLVEWGGKRYRINHVKFYYVSSFEGIQFKINGFKLKKDGTPSAHANDIHSYRPITVIEKATA